MGLTVRRRKGSKNWQIRGTVTIAGGGTVYVEESTGTADKRAAGLIASRRELELVAGGITGGGQGLSFLEGSVSYLATLGDGKDRATAEQKRIIGKFLAHFKTDTLAGIGQQKIEEAALKLWPGSKPDTVRRYVGAFQALANHCEARGQSESPADAPFRGYRAPAIDKRKWPAGKGRDRWLTTEEAARFVEHAGDDLKAFFTFMLYTGARLSDGLTLEWRNVNLTHSLCTFRDDKNGDDRQCHLPEPAFMALANLRREDEPGRVFFMWKDKKELYKAWRPAAKAAKLSDVTPHILCHTYATWLIEYADANPKDLLETRRWKSLTSVMRYFHAPEKRVRAKIDALPSAVPPKKAQEG
jgi:integrase